MKIRAIVATTLICLMLTVVFTVRQANAQDLSDTQEVVTLDFGQTAAMDQLASQSGGDGASIDRVYLFLSDATTNAEMENNILNGGFTGSNYLSEKAFSGSNGINTVFQVTGNMNILQSNYIINVSIN